MLIEITKTAEWVVNIKEVPGSPPSHQELNFSAAAGSFSTILSSSTGGTDTVRDTLTIIHDVHGTIGSFKASEFSVPSGADLSEIRPLVDQLLSI